MLRNIIKKSVVFAAVFCPLSAMADSATDISDLKRAVSSEFNEYCKPGSALTFEKDAFLRFSNGLIEFRSWKASCDWADGTNPFCGASRCGVSTYKLQGSTYVLVKDELR